MTDRICVAQIGAAHGLRGEVRLRSFTQDPEAVTSYGPLESEDGARRFEIERRSGRTFEDAREDELLKGLLAPERADRLCNLLFVDFGSTYAHGAHPLGIAPVMLPRMLAALDV